MSIQKTRAALATLLIASAVLWTGELAVGADPSAANRSGDAAAKTDGDPRPVKPAKVRYRLESIRGRVVWMADALKRRHGINSKPEAKQRILAIETKAGQLHPIVEDLRGRSFRTDKRLREMDVELLVRRYQGSPMVQIIRIYQIKKGGKYELDYWCDVCAIIMFEDGPCDCCQDHNRLRTRLVAPQRDKR